MNENSTQDLISQLREKTAQNRAEVDALMSGELSKQIKDFKASLHQDLNTINKDIRRALLNRWKIPLLTGFMAFLSICVATWGLMSFLSFQITNQIKQIDGMEAGLKEVKTLEETLKGLKTTETLLKTYGMGMTVKKCGKEKLVCIQIDEKAVKYKDGFRIPTRKK